MRRRTRHVLLASLATLVLAVAGLWFARDALLEAALDWTLARFEDRLVVEQPRASFSGRLSADRIVWEDGGLRVEIEAARLVFEPLRLLERELIVQSLSAERAAVRIEPSAVPEPEAAPPQLPAALALPLRLRIERAAIGRLELHTGQLALEARALEGALAFDGGAWRIDSLGADLAFGALPDLCSPSCRVDASGQLGAQSPYDFRTRFTASGPVQGQPIEARLALDGRLHREPAGLDGLAATGTLELVDREPGPIDAGRWPVARLRTELELDGAQLALRNLAVFDRPEAESAVLAGSGSLGLRTLEGELELGAEALDAARLHTRLTPTSLSGPITVTVDAEQVRFRTRLSEANAPLEAALEGVLLGARAPESVRIDRLELKAYGGRAQAEGRLGLGERLALQASLRFEDFDPSRLLQVPAMRLAGSAAAELTLAGTPSGTLRLVLEDSRFADRPLSMQAEADGSLQAFRLALDARLGENTLAASGSLDGERARVQWRGRLAEPALLDARLGGELTASGTLSGRPLAPRFELTAESGRLSFEERVFEDLSLSLAGELAEHRIELEARHLGTALRLAARGSGPASFDAIDVGSRWSGHLEALRIGAPIDLRLVGAAPLELSAERVALGPARLELAQGSIEIGETRVAAAGIQSSGRFAELAVAPWLELLGDPLRARGIEPRLVLAGDWSLAYRPDAPASERLQGRLSARRTGGDLRFVRPDDGGTPDARSLGLEQARLALSLEGEAASLALELETTRGAGLQADLRALPDRAQPLGMPTEVSGTARLRELPLAHWLGLLGPDTLGQRAELEDLRIGGTGSFRWLPRSGSPQALEAELLLERTAGDVSVAAGEGTLALELQAARLEVRARDGRLTADARLRSARDMAITAELDAPLAIEPGSVALDASASWTGSLDASLALAALGPLLTEDVRIQGRLAADIALSGTPRSPRVDGSISGDELALTHPESGLQLVDGGLRARLEGDRLAVTEWTMYLPEDAAGGASGANGGGTRRAGDAAQAAASGRPRVSATGVLPLDPDAPGHLEFTATRLPLPIAPEQRVVVSGDGRIEQAEGGIRLTVQARADEALIRLVGQSRPSLAQDVVIRRPDDAPAEQAPESGEALPFSARIELDLGDSFRVLGEGISARLAGQLTLEAEGADSLRARGEVRIVDGRYTQLGTTLLIERGLLRFSGPIDNPGLDILATRNDIPVRVWARISGTAQQPVVTLGSDEPMTDAQRLAWLALGTPLSEDPAAAQSAALQAAARALLGSLGGGEGESLAQSLGVDVLGVRTDAEGTSFVTVGKRVSERLFVAYEQGLRGVWNIVRAELTLSRRLQLSLQAGSESAVDLLLTVPFN